MKCRPCVVVARVVTRLFRREPDAAAIIAALPPLVPDPAQRAKVKAKLRERVREKVAV